MKREKAGHYLQTSNARTKRDDSRTGKEEEKKDGKNGREWERARSKGLLHASALGCSERKGGEKKGKRSLTCAAIVRECTWTERSSRCHERKGR